MILHPGLGPFLAPVDVMKSTNVLLYWNFPVFRNFKFESEGFFPLENWCCNMFVNSSLKCFNGNHVTEPQKNQIILKHTKKASMMDIYFKLAYDILEMSQFKQLTCSIL